jgi:hypothetical protein
MTLQNQQKNQQIALRNQELTLESQKQALETRQTQLFLELYGTATEENIIKVGELGKWTWKDHDERAKLFVD